MYQAHAQQLLNQKEFENDSSMFDNPQNPVNKATRRLVSALDRLERNLQHVTVEQERSIQQEQQLMHYARENDSLKSERDKLARTIVTLEEQYAELHKVANMVHTKLDASIDRINQIIEG